MLDFSLQNLIANYKLTGEYVFINRGWEVWFLSYQFNIDF